MLLFQWYEKEIPSTASLGVLNPSPMDFQKRFPPFPGLFPFPVFFELRKQAKQQQQKSIQPQNHSVGNKVKRSSK